MRARLEGAMTVRILLDGPSRPVGPRIARALAVTVSLSLIVAGVIGWAGFAAVIYFLATSSAPASDLRNSLPAAAVFPAAALIGLPLGIRLLRGKRRVVLFLRRFGFADATKALSYAANAAIGRSARLVTFDDAQVKVVGGPAAPRRLAGLVIVTAIAAGGGFGWWLWTKGLVIIYKDTSSAPVTTTTATSDAGKAIASAFLSAMAAMFIVFIISVLVTSFVVSVGLFSAANYRFARRAERAKRIEISTMQDVRRRSRLIAKRGSRIFAPRLLVVTVANQVWQQAVSSFARGSAVVIIDVSIPSESVLWEIRALLPVMGQRCILVGRMDLLTRQDLAGRTVVVSPMASDIDGHEVLVYRTDGPGIRRFSRALRATIEARARR
jgi:hypothetical protein